MTTTSMIGPEIVEKLNSEAIQYISSTAFFPINITTTWNALPYGVDNSRTVNTCKNRLDAHWEGNPPDVHVNW